MTAEPPSSPSALCPSLAPGVYRFTTLSLYPATKLRGSDDGRRALLERLVSEAVPSCSPSDAVRAILRRALRVGKGHQIQTDQLTAALIYQYGFVVSPCPQRSAFFYRLAAEQGDPVGQWALGVRYQNGDGVEKCHGNAATLLLASAVQGHPRAEEDLARVLLAGGGVDQSFGEARKLLARAHERHDSDSSAAGRVHEKVVFVEKLISDICPLLGRRVVIGGLTPDSPVWRLADPQCLENGELPRFHCLVDLFGAACSEPALNGVCGIVVDFGLGSGVEVECFGGGDKVELSWFAGANARYIVQLDGQEGHVQVRAVNVMSEPRFQATDGVRPLRGPTGAPAAVPSRPPRKYRCAVCAAPSRKRCPCSSKVRYCSEVCQRVHWKSHRGACELSGR